LSRYLDVTEESFDLTEESIRNVINQKFINTAEGESLDRIGELFGPLIGNRGGRNDTEYRILLRSVVQSFISRGTTNGIKLAVSASVDVDEELISIREDFQNNSYEVVIQPNQPFTGSIVEDVAEIADPSGVLNAGTVIDVPADTLSSDDDVNVVPPVSIDEILNTDDIIELPPPESVDDTVSTVDTASLPSPTRSSESVSTQDIAFTTEKDIDSFVWGELLVQKTGSSSNSWETIDWDVDNWSDLEVIQTNTGENWDFFQWRK
jgi:hypothetical protein